MMERLLERSMTSGRIDDTLAIFEKRYEGYLKDTMPVVEHLKKEGVRLIGVSSKIHPMQMRRLNKIDILGRRGRASMDQI